MLTKSRSRTAPRVVTTAAFALSALVLVGCSAAPEGEVASPRTPAASSEAAVAFTASADSFEGVGSNFDPGVEVTIPEGAQSLEVRFQCEGDGGFSVEFGDTMATGLGNMMGPCGDAVDFVWPVDERSIPRLRVVAGEDAAWSMDTQFSEASFTADAELGHDCAAFGTANDGFLNADSGYDMGEVSADEWSTRVADATAALFALADSATSELAPVIATMRDEVRAAEPVIGAADQLFGPTYRDAQIMCAANHTPLVGFGEFGG